MAAKTASVAGNWELDATFGGTAYAQAPDTATLNVSVVNTANLTIGSSPATGGTPATQFGSVTDKSLTVNSGVQHVEAGDFKFANSDTQKENKLIFAAGAIYAFLPASGQQYKFDCQVNSHIICNGTSGSHVTVKTDLSSSGLAAYTLVGGYTVSGFHTCTYTDFIDLGDASNYGVQVNRGRGGVFYPNANSHLTITDSTFTRASFKGVFCGGDWDGNVTIQRNSFADSTTVFVAATYNVCFSVNFQDAGTSGTWLIDSNGFDAVVHFTNYRPRISFTNNIAAGVYIQAGSWAAGKFDGNIITSCQDQGLFGPTASCYFLTEDTTNPHWVAVNGSGSPALTDSVFDPPDSVDAVGDIIGFATTGVVTPMFTGNLVLARSNASAGTFVNVGAGYTGLASGSSVTVNHNTMIGESESGLVALSESSASFTGEVASCRSNLRVSSASGTGEVYVVYQGGAGAIVVDAVTLADYNATLNADTGTCKHNTSTSQAGVLGYLGIEVSTVAAFPNAQIGLNDKTLSGTVAALFVDSEYNAKKWSVFKGQAETDAAAIAYAVANPTAATDATNGLRAKVRAAFRVTGTDGLSLQDAAHEGVGYTIGAMGYVAASTGKRMDNRFLCQR